MATDPLQELKRRRAQALTPVADPLDELKRRRSLMEETALSPIMEEAPFAVDRPVAGAGPRRGFGGLPEVEVTAPAPKPFERRLARTLMEGTRKAEPFGGEEELTPEQRQQLRRAVTGRAMAEDLGKAIAGQPERTIYRTAAGIAQLRGDPRAQRLLEQTRAIEEATAPETGVGMAARAASEIGAFIPSGLLTGALRTGLESAAGEEFSTAGMLAKAVGVEGPQTAMGRALADAAVDLAIPGALAGIRGVRSARRAVAGAGDMAADAFTQGLREGAREAAEAATPSLANAAPGLLAPRGAPQSNIMRRLTARAGTLPATETGPLGPAIPTGAPRAPETRPSRMLPAETGRTVPLGAEPAPITGAPQGPAIPMPAGVVAPEGPVSPLSRLLAPQSEALRQRQFMMPPAYGPIPLPEGAMSVRGPATSLTPQLPAQAASLRQRQFMMPPAYGPFPLPEGAGAVRGPVSSLLPQLPAEAASVRQRLLMMPPAYGPFPAGSAAGRGAARAGAIPGLEGMDETALQRALAEVEGEVRPPRGGEPMFTPEERMLPTDVVLRRRAEAEDLAYEADLAAARAAEEAPGKPKRAKRPLVESMRTQSGVLRKPENVTTEALFDELEDLTARQDRDIAKSQPSYVETNWGGDNVMAIHVNRRAAGPSMQAKASQRVRQTNKVIDRIWSELEKRVGPENMADAMEARRAERERLRAEKAEAYGRDFDEGLAMKEARLAEQQAAQAGTPSALQPPATAAVTPTTPQAPAAFQPIQRSAGKLSTRAPDFAETKNYDLNIPEAPGFKIFRNSGYGEMGDWYIIDPYIKGPESAVKLAVFTRKDAEEAALGYINKAKERGGVFPDDFTGKFLPYPPDAFRDVPRPESRASLAATGALGGVGTGVATEGEEDLTPMQRALLIGAGVAGGAAALRARRAQTAARVAPSIPELAPVAETINVGKRATAPAAPSVFDRPVSEASGVRGAIDRTMAPIKAKADRIYTQLVSETYAIEQAAKRFGTAEQAEQVPRLIAQQQGSRRAARGYLEDTLTPVLQGLSPAEQESVRSLLKARRDLQIRQKGGAAKSAVPLDQLEASVAAGNAVPKIAQAADQITAMHRDLLDMRFKAGLLSQEAYDAIKASDDFYTPLFRELAEDASQTLPGSRGGRFNIFSSGVRRMDRTAEALEQTADPLEMVIADAARTYRDVGRQRVANVIFDLADAEKLPFIKRIQADPTNPPKRDGVIQQTRNGKLYTYEVTDPDLFNALAGQSQLSTNALMRYGNLLKNIKTAGITVLPDFAIANVVRDVAMSGVQRPDVARAVRESAAGAAIGGIAGVTGTEEGESAVKNFMIGAGLGSGAGLYARPFAETMGAVKSILRNEKLYRDFLADGASTEGFYVRNADDASKILRELQKTPGFSMEDIISPKNWWETLRKIGSVAEQSTRLAAYRQVKEATGDAAAAALAAQDRTLRFANIGGGKSVKGIAALTPFWNAKVQGWDKLARLMKDPKTWGLGAGMLTAPSIALWSVNKDNPEYWERPVWERNLFWLVPKGMVGEEGEKGFYRIPKPFEIGFLFASLPERALDYATQAGVDLPFVNEIQSATPVVAEPERVLTRAAKDMAAATFEGTLPIPEAIATPLQIAANRDFFRNRPIVTKPNLPTEMQDVRESSAIARALSKAGISPEQTDFVIRSTFGTAGSEVSKAADILARRAGLPAPEAPPGAARVPFVGRFAERFTTSTKGQTDPEAIARERLRELAKVEAGFREVVRRGDREAAKQYVRDNMADLELAKKIQPVETQLEQLSTLRTQVLKSPSMSPEDRQIALDILRRRGQKLSEILIGVPER